MPLQTTTDCFLFPELFSRPVVVSFDQGLASSDGGAMLLKAADRRVGLTGAMSEVLWERRQPGKVKHRLDELLSQRIYSIACGYPDANDAARLGDNPIYRMLIGRYPATGGPLASQPTLSRFKKTVSQTDLPQLGRVLLEQVLARHGRRLETLRTHRR